MKLYPVIVHLNGDQWILGVYDSHISALGNIMDDVFRQLEDIKNNTDDPVTMEIDHRYDNFSGSFFVIVARFSETDYNAEHTVQYQVFIGEKEF